MGIAGEEVDLPIFDITILDFFFLGGGQLPEMIAYPMGKIAEFRPAT